MVSFPLLLEHSLSRGYNINMNLDENVATENLCAVLINTINTSVKLFMCTHVEQDSERPCNMETRHATIID